MDGILLKSGSPGIDPDGCTATPDKVLAPYTFGGYGNDDPQAGTIPIVGGSTIMPGTSAKTAVAAGRYVSGNVMVVGDPGLIAGNIKKGVTVFGVQGAHDGFVPGPMDVYNRGAWGSGFSNSFVGRHYSSAWDGRTITMTSQASALKMYVDGSGSMFFNKFINLSPYNTINVLCSTPYSSRNTFRVEVYPAIPAYTEYAATVGIGTSGEGTAEKAVSINISALNISAYIAFSGNTTGFNCYIHRIWFA